eukprot:6198405-Pleurochrysis_carterae.AAC.5
MAPKKKQEKEPEPEPEPELPPEPQEGEGAFLFPNGSRYGEMKPFAVSNGENFWWRARAIGSSNQPENSVHISDPVEDDQQQSRKSWPQPLTCIFSV